MLLSESRYSTANTSPLDAIVVLRDRVIARSIAERKEQDALTVALRTAYRDGAGIDELSDASGLTPEHVLRRLNETPIDAELAALSAIIV